MSLVGEGYRHSSARVAGMVGSRLGTVCRSSLFILSTSISEELPCELVKRAAALSRVACEQTQTEP